MKMAISIGRCLNRKTMLVWVKEYINKNFATCKSLCNLQELYNAFKEEHPNINIGFSKFCALRPNGVFWLTQKFYSICLLFKHSSKWCVASHCNGLGFDIQRPGQEDCSKPWEQKMHHALVWILSWHCNSKRISWSRTQQPWRWCENYCQWYTTDCAILTTFTATFKEHKDTLIDVIDDLTRHSYIAKLKITSSWYRTKSLLPLE